MSLGGVEPPPGRFKRPRSHERVATVVKAMSGPPQAGRSRIDDEPIKRSAVC